MTDNPRRLIVLAFGVGMLVWSLGLFGPAAILPYLQSERGWPVALISAAITAHFLMSALVVAVMPEIRRTIGLRGAVFAGAVAIYAGFIADCATGASRVFPAGCRALQRMRSRVRELGNH